MRPHATPLEFTPLFDWTPPRRRKLSIVSFIVASTVLHALCFYLFQVIYPPTVALLPPPARVNIITDASEDGRLLLRWIEAEDPALSSMTQRPPDAPPVAPPSATHVPSYANWRPVLRELPPLPPAVGIPSARPPGPVATGRPRPPVAPPTSASALQFGPETESLGQPTIPPLQFTASRREVPQSAEFRVAITAGGAICHCFLQRSSGDPALDEQARRAILLSRFAPAEGAASRELIWTIATLDWGNDVAPLADAAAAGSKP